MCQVTPPPQHGMCYSGKTPTLRSTFSVKGPVMHPRLRARLAALVLPLSILGYIALMALLAFLDAPQLAHWFATLGGAGGLAWLVRWDRRRAKRGLIKGIRRAIADPQPHQEARELYASAQD